MTYFNNLSERKRSGLSSEPMGHARKTFIEQTLFQIGQPRCITIGAESAYEQPKLVPQLKHL